MPVPPLPPAPPLPLVPLVPLIPAVPAPALAPIPAPLTPVGEDNSRLAPPPPWTRHWRRYRTAGAR